MKILILFKILAVILILLIPAGTLSLILGTCFSNEVAVNTGLVLMGIPVIIEFIIVPLVAFIFYIIIE